MNVGKVRYKFQVIRSKHGSTKIDYIVFTMPRNYSPSKYYGLDNDVKIYANNIALAGGSISLQVLTYVNQFVVGVKAANLWNLINEMGVFCGNNLASALIRLKYVPGTGASLINNNFIESDYNERGTSGGLLGNGTNKYLNTLTQRRLIWANGNNHLSVFTRYTVLNGQLIGARGGDIDTVYTLGLGSSNNSDFSDQNNSSAVLFFNPTPAPSASHLIGNDVNWQINVFQNGSSIALSFTAVTFGLGGTAPLTLFARNTNGSISAFSSNAISFYSAGRGLTSTQAAAFSTLVVKLQTQLNRNI